MNIGEAAVTSGITAKMIRYYETIGLIPKAGRTEAGYRLYSPSDVNTLRFIRRARDFGMSIPRIERLIGLWLDRDRPSREVKKIAMEHVRELDARIAELTSMAETLKELADRCHGDSRPDCPVLRDLESFPRPR